MTEITSYVQIKLKCRNSEYLIKTNFEKLTKKS